MATSGDPFLSKPEVERLTARKYAAAQIRVLIRRKIPYIPDGDGRPLVLREYIFGTRAQAPSQTEPDFDAAFPSPTCR